MAGASIYVQYSQTDTTHECHCMASTSHTGCKTTCFYMLGTFLSLTNDIMQFIICTICKPLFHDPYRYTDAICGSYWVMCIGQPSAVGIKIYNILLNLDNRAIAFFCPNPGTVCRVVSTAWSVGCGFILIL